LEYGGFPAVVLANPLDTKRRALDDVLGSYFELDVWTSHFEIGIKEA